LPPGWGGPIGIGTGAGIGLVFGVMSGQIALGLSLGAGVGLVIGIIATTAAAVPTSRRRVRPRRCVMSPTPTLDRSSTSSKRQTDRRPRSAGRFTVVVAVTVVAVLLAALVAGVATGFLRFGDTASEDPPVADQGDAVSGQPADDEPGQPADEAVADEPANDAAAAADVRYSDEPRANWDVIGVADNDVLNMRSRPGAHHRQVGTLAPDAAELESTGRVAHVSDRLWREIIVPGDGAGWVNAAYLTETR
jgi:hypothetical protein